MGIPSSKLVYDFKRKFNAINSGGNREIPLVDIIAYLNEGQEIWFENRCLIAETNHKVRNDLRPVKVVKESLSMEKVDDSCYLAKFPSSLYKRLNHIAVVKKDCCPNPKEIVPRIIQSDDLHEGRLNPYRKADFFYEQLMAQEGSDGLYIYHDNEMEIVSVYIDYYRRPSPINAPSLDECGDGAYYSYDGSSVNSDTEFEFDKTYCVNDVVDVAVLIALRDVGDVQSFQTKLEEILRTESFFKVN